jgi:RNA-directed DNA polymerase
LKSLSLALGLTLEELRKLSNNPNDYYREFDIKVRGKNRHLVEAAGKLKKVQRRILDELLRRLPRQECSFGASKGRTIKDNARIHAKSRYMVKLDIKDFYPNIRSQWVYEFFMKQNCSPDVAHILTALTTRNHALPLGTATSPMLADQIVQSIDNRINGMAKRTCLKYTRYVDDITLSGDFPLERIARTAIKVLRQAGFKVKREKLVLYRALEQGEERIVTGVSIRDGKISAPVYYMGTLEKELKDAVVESKKSVPEGNFMPSEHYRGKIGYVQWLDPPVGKKLMRFYRRVKWKHLEWATGANATTSVGENGVKSSDSQFLLSQG